jgi:hypothetical protein
VVNNKLINVGFSTHRPETLPFAARYMRQHEAILLEEPEVPGFSQMLSGEMSIADYLHDTEFEFSGFSRLSCELFRSLNARGKQLFQVDPFMTELNAIHEYFSNGGKPDEIDANSSQGRVYAAERSWTRSLLAYYEGCLTRPFDEVIEMVKCFARDDAARGCLRDQMRASAIVTILPRFNSVYVEAGSLHVPLINQLISILPKEYRLRPLFIMASVVKQFCDRRQTLGPGDKLTLHYSYRPDYSSAHADLLAARSLIHSKIQAKEELLGVADEFPHTRNEVETITLVEHLSYRDCKALYAEVKYASTSEALTIVRRYLSR